MIQTVFSGIVTEAPSRDPAALDRGCHLCGAAPIELDYHDEQIGVYCPECRGIYAGGSDDTGALPAERNRLYYMHLPPAGLADRDVAEINLAASRWTNAETVTAAPGICPRCSAPLSEGVDVCGDHDASDGPCQSCDSRFAVTWLVSCDNCGYRMRSMFANKLLANLEFRRFLIDEGVNPLHPKSERFLHIFHCYEETVRSSDPLIVELSFIGTSGTVRFRTDDELAIEYLGYEPADRGTDWSRGNPALGRSEAPLPPDQGVIASTKPTPGTEVTTTYPGRITIYRWQTRSVST